MISERSLLNRIIITIEANNKQVAKKLLHGSLLNQVSVHKLLNLYFNNHVISQGIYLDKLTLNLGEINSPDFNSLFPIRFNAELNKALSQYWTNNQEKIFTENSIIPKNTDKFDLLHSDYLSDIEEFIQYLYRKDFELDPENIMSENRNIDVKIKSLIDQLMRIENNLTLLLAKSCLSEHGLQRLLAISQPALLTAINRKLSENIDIPVIFQAASLLAALSHPGHIVYLCSQGFAPLPSRCNLKSIGYRSQHQGKVVTSWQLVLNALGYIHRYNTQEIPKPDMKVISYIIAEFNNSMLDIVPIITLFRQNIVDENTLLNAWLKLIWQIEWIPQLCKKHLSVQEYKNLVNRFGCETKTLREQSLQQTDPANSMITELLQELSTKHWENFPILNQHQIYQDQSILSTPDNLHDKDNNGNQLRTVNRPHPESGLSSPYQVSNAGILILWPMLPVLFNQLGLLEEKKFIHHQAQFRAVDFLDYLIWGDEETQIERKTLNKILCGLMIDEETQSIAVEPEKQLIIEQWLDAIIAQLPGWKKLSRNDVRQLFLQRPGELLIDEQEIKITLQHQPFDLLLADWPWPLNIAKLPWLNYPLQVDW
ncbi:contractile injection system tape measure protein [Photorhabdus africana]|uniref:contractile injection system tape measure protein n=1 Tax=Photorhabdus africana TaxID=3097554 RepID=UPI002B403D64|nr:contractile injection system tape measure protein [Photorhabdus sp. CRI-LC]